MQSSTLFALAILAVHVAPATAGGKCFDGPLSVEGHDVPKETLLKSVVGVFFDGAGKAIAGDDDFKSFMQSRGQCQATCAEKMVTRAVSTLYGKCGEGFFGDDCEKLAIESLTGAFMACFPSAPRDQVHSTMGYVMDNMGKTPAKDNSDLFKDNKECPNKAVAEFFDVEAFTEGFGKAFGEVVDSKPGVKKFFEEEALGCQVDCLKETIPTAALTLAMTANKDKAEILQAVTGAARACFPGVPRADVKDLMAAVIKVFEGNTGSAEKLYDANIKVESMSWTSLPMIGGAATMSLVIFAAGVVSMRRSGVSGREQRSVPMGSESELEEALDAEQ